MSGSTALLKSIAEVSQSLAILRYEGLDSSVVSAELTASRNAALIESVQKVSLLQKNYHASHPQFPAVFTPKLLKSLFLVSSSVLNRFQHLEEGEGYQKSVFRAIRREADENLHSDCISVLLQSATMGPFAHRFFDLLCAWGGGWSHGEPALRKELTGHTISRREVRLSTIDSTVRGGHKAERRIDILAEGSNRIVVIENKVESGESHNQTQDYFESVRRYSKRKHPDGEVFAILLSPDGRQAECEHFRSLGYDQLFALLRRLTHFATPSDGKHVYDFYCSELYRTFVQPRIAAIKGSASFWKGKGYDGN